MFLYGASGHAKVIIDILENNGIHIDGLFDDNTAINNLFNYPVFATGNLRGPLIISIGNNEIRKRIVEAVNVEIAQFIHHTSAVISPRACVGDGTVIMQGALVQADVNIGEHCIINTGASVDHDCFIDNFVHISPHTTLCGNVSVGEGTWIGAGSVVIPGVKIGKWSTIGAGSVVTKDIPDNVLAVGNRCKIIKKYEY